jgi:hypothetical protein
VSAAGRIPPWIIPVLLPVLVLALFGPSVPYAFAPLDDDVNIVFNPNHGPLTGARVAASFSDTSYIRRYQPLGWILNSAVATFSGLSPWGYHATNVALHALNSVLLFILLRAIATRFDPSPATSGLWPMLAPALAAAWWALHPLRVESVAWVSALPVNLALAGLLLSLRLSLRETTPGGIVLPVLVFSASLISYPVGLGASVLFPLIDWANGRRGRVWVLRALPYLGAAFAVGLLNLAARAHAGAEHAPVPTLLELPASYRILRGFCFLTHYWWKPWLPFDLSPVYSELLHVTWRSPCFLAGVVLAGVAGWLAWRSRAFALLLLAQIAVLLPITGATELLHFPHDRYSLWSDLAIAAGLALLLVRYRSRAAGVALAGVVVAGAWLASRQLPVWQSTATIIASVRSHLAPGDATPIRDVRPAFWLFREGHYVDARNLLDGELARRPGDPQLASARQQLAEMESSHAHFVASLGLTPADVPPVALLHYRLAHQFSARGEIEPAAWHLAEIARLAPLYYAVLDRSRPPADAAKR